MTSKTELVLTLLATQESMMCCRDEHKVTHVQVAFDSKPSPHPDMFRLKPLR